MLKQLLKKIVILLITTEARLVLRKYKPKIIAVTGSVGKTGTKDAIYTALSTSFYIRKSEKSFNSEIGIPLAILGCRNAWSSVAMWLENIIEGLALIFLKNHYPKWLILEVGTGRPGDIKKITRWLKPDIAVLTRFPDVPVHVEFFPSPEAIIEEKLHVVRAMKSGGTLIVNADDEKMKSVTVSPAERLLSFGFGRNAVVAASHISYTYEDGAVKGMSFHVNYNGRSVPLALHGSVGNQHIYSLLAAFAVGVSEGIHVVKLAQALENHKTPLGRMRLIQGSNNFVIIDDSYNSSPVAASMALETLRGIDVKGRKIAVLGDMLELGNYSAEAHRKVGEQTAQIANILITVGIRSRDIAKGAHKTKMYKRNIFEFEDTKAAGEKLKEVLESGDVVLVKGSQGMRMERVVEAIMASPERKRELLVRQDPEWLRKV